jgi:ribosomal protein S18 acetylase RimI-like enzyme
MAMEISLLKEHDIPLLTSAFNNVVWNTPETYFQKLLEAQEKGEIDFLVACSDKVVAGFVYIKWQADYPPFAEKNIPEIRDLRVLPEFRRRGIATVLMDEAEKRIFTRSKFAGLGVGLYADYGPAQLMYVRRGYVPDGRGLMYRNRPVNPGREISVDDELLMFLIKEHK